MENDTSRLLRWENKNLSNCCHVKFSRNRYVALDVEIGKIFLSNKKRTKNLFPPFQVYIVYSLVLPFHFNQTLDVLERDERYQSNKVTFQNWKNSHHHHQMFFFTKRENSSWQMDTYQKNWREMKKVQGEWFHDNKSYIKKTLVKIKTILWRCDGWCWHKMLFKILI